MERDKLLSAMMVMSRAGNDCDEQVTQLRAMGFSEGEAVRAVAFIPLGFSRPLLEKLGITVFSDVAAIRTPSGELVKILLSDQPEYITALSAARDHFENGALPREAFEKIALSSSDLDAVNSALNKGADIKGATVATAFNDIRLLQFVKR